MQEHLLLVDMQMYFQQLLNVQNFYILRSDLKEKLTRSITGFNCCERCIHFLTIQFLPIMNDSAMKKFM